MRKVENGSEGFRKVEKGLEEFGSAFSTARSASQHFSTAPQAHLNSPQGYSQQCEAHLDSIVAIRSRYSASTSSKVPSSVLSISMTPHTSPRPSSSSSSVRNIGTTISERLNDEHAICPGNSSTSGTTSVFRSFQAAPHTPFPYGIS